MLIDTLNRLFNPFLVLFHKLLAALHSTKINQTEYFLK